MFSLQRGIIKKKEERDFFSFFLKTRCVNLELLVQDRLLVHSDSTCAYQVCEGGSDGDGEHTRTHAHSFVCIHM